MNTVPTSSHPHAALISSSDCLWVLDLQLGHAGAEHAIPRLHAGGFQLLGEVQAETRVAMFNQLLADGSVVLGVHLLTAVREMEQGTANGAQQQKRDTQRDVRRMVGYVVGRRRE